MAHRYTGQSRLASLARLQRIKKWHITHREDHPLEYQIWDTMLTIWVTGWIAWLPAFALDALWAFPFCIAAVLTPRIYVRLRRYAHASGLVRCEWLHLLK